MSSIDPHTLSRDPIRRRTNMKRMMIRITAIAMLFAALIFPAPKANAQYINGGFIKGANLPWLDGAYSTYLGNDPHNWGWGVGYNSAHMQRYLQDMHNMGVTVVRLWVNQDDMGCYIDGNGRVTGVQSTFWNNLDNTVWLAGVTGVKLYITCNNGRTDFLTDGNKEWAYLNNCFGPMVSRYWHNPNIFAFDIMNEIDACVGGPDGNWGSGASWAQAQNMVRDFANVIHSRDNTRKCSCSVGWHGYSNVWRLKGCNLDFYDFHLYNDWPWVPSASSLGLDRPVYIGECGQSSNWWDDNIQNNCIATALSRAKANGYAGVGVWAYQYPGCSDKYTLVYSNGSWRPVCYTIHNFN